MNSRQSVSASKRFNIRVYGLLLQDSKVLVVDEVVQAQTITKFPGGGLEWGEGTADCLIREFKEETGIDVSVKQHIYTTDFFQPSAFIPDDQIISIYYQVEPTARLADQSIEVSHKGLQPNEEILGFRWLELSQLSVDDVTLPIDQYLVQMLINDEIGAL